MKLFVILAFCCLASASENQLQHQLDPAVADNCKDSTFVADECGVDCLFGWKNNEHGCPICECVTEGEELPYQGDIILAKKTRTIIEDAILGRGSSAYPSIRWTQYLYPKYYAIPYTYGTSNGDVRNAVDQAKAWFAQYTCIRLVPRTNEPDYVNVVLGSGCTSYVGRNGGSQNLSLGYGCHSKGTAIHEFLHAAGFFHEQSRPDRDNHVRILWENIPENLKFAFRKQSINSLGSPYETKSVMQYYSGAFATNGNSMVTIDGDYIPWNHLPTVEDANQLNKFYECV